MILAILLLAAVVSPPDERGQAAPPTAQELGYPKGCVALYGGTGGVHLIKVDCPGPDLSGPGRDLAREAACAGGPTKLKADRDGSKASDYECLPPPPSETLEELGLVAVDLTTPEEVRKATAEFEKDIRSNGSTTRVRNCRLVILLTAGRRDANNSYGAVCDISDSDSKPERVMLCNDEIVGHFGLASQLPATRDAVIEFVKQHCIGG